MKLIIIFFALFVSGCATVTQFNSVPVTEEEFSQPLEDIRKNYSDIPLYESGWRGLDPEVGDFESLTEKWGEPDRIEKNWDSKISGTFLNTAFFVLGNGSLAGFLFIESLIFFPGEDNYWEKGNYEIIVGTHRHPFAGYKKRVGIWRWNEKKDLESAKNNFEALKDMEQISTISVAE